MRWEEENKKTRKLKASPNDKRHQYIIGDNIKRERNKDKEKLRRIYRRRDREKYEFFSNTLPQRGNAILSRE